MAVRIETRPARPDDVAAGARLLYLSGPEICTFGFARPPEAAEQLLAALWPHPHHLFSHRWGHLAVVDGRAQGLLMAYPGAAMSGAALALGWLLLRHSSLREFLRMVGNGLSLMRVMAPVPRSDLYIGHLATLPEARGRGIGTRLLALAEELARQGGYRHTSLDVFIENTRARALYERVGYMVARVATSRRLRRGTGYSGVIRIVRPV
jgi:ribosomal protein S18 acetylase RimI-like enzyme